MRESQVLDFENEEDEKLLDEPHVSLWLPRPEAHDLWPEIYRPNQNWYVALNWRKEQRGRVFYGRISLSSYCLYPQAYSTAIAWGKKLGIPVIKHGHILIWAPDSKQTREQKEIVQYLIKGKEVSL